MLPDPDDVMISSAELLENGPLVVTFYRGIWCPYCRQDLKHLGNAAPDIRSCGASLVAIAHQTVPDSNGKFQREHGLEFPILDDRQGDVAVAYRIRWSPQELAARRRAAREAPGLGHRNHLDFADAVALRHRARWHHRLCRYQCRLSAAS